MGKTCVYTVTTKFSERAHNSSNIGKQRHNKGKALCSAWVMRFRPVIKASRNIFHIGRQSTRPQSTR